LASGTNNQIRALVQHRLDDWRDAKVEAIAPLRPGLDEVLIATKAASLNFADLLMMEGKYPNKAPLPSVPGRDAAGTVLAVGDQVRGFTPGDQVVATPNHGAFAEQTIASTGVCHKMPAGVSFEDAAACGTGIPTIVAAISLRARLKPGEWLLISGAAGRMGSLAVQYAKALGGHVAALVSSAEKENLVLKLGADLVLRSDDIADLKAGLRAALEAKGIDGVDLAIDMGRGRRLRRDDPLYQAGGAARRRRLCLRANPERRSELSAAQGYRGDRLVDHAPVQQPP